VHECVHVFMGMCGSAPVKTCVRVSVGVGVRVCRCMAVITCACLCVFGCERAWIVRGNSATCYTSS
jgi:hypothetical protein